MNNKAKHPTLKIQPVKTWVVMPYCECGREINRESLDSLGHEQTCKCGQKHWITHPMHRVIHDSTDNIKEYALNYNAEVVEDDNG